VTIIEQWLNVLGRLGLADDPHVLVSSPDDEDDVLTALSRARPGARVVLLDIGSRPQSPSSDIREFGLHRIGAAAFANRQGIAASSLDAALFDHALDDIIVDAVARREGIEQEEHRGEHAAKARAVRAYWRSGELERVARPALIQLVAACANALKRAAPLVFCHRVASADLPGQPMDLYTDYLALARSWVLSSDLGFREVALDGFDPHWWMRLERAPEAV
jgi:hypothetical protein